MPRQKDQKSNARLIIATSLFAISILASFLFSYLSHSGKDYWMLTRPVAAGAPITSSDLKWVKAEMSPDIRGYLTSTERVINLVALRNLRAGELVHRSDISSEKSRISRAYASISVRAVDLPSNINVGSIVNLYHLQDSRNGEPVPEPELILSQVFVNEISRKSANFASDIALTLSLDINDVPYLLAATTAGRIVVVKSNE